MTLLIELITLISDDDVSEKSEMAKGKNQRVIEVWKNISSLSHCIIWIGNDEQVRTLNLGKSEREPREALDDSEWRVLVDGYFWSCGSTKRTRVAIDRSTRRTGGGGVGMHRSSRVKEGEETTIDIYRTLSISSLSEYLLGSFVFDNIIWLGKRAKWLQLNEKAKRKIVLRHRGIGYFSIDSNHHVENSVHLYERIRGLAIGKRTISSVMLLPLSRTNFKAVPTLH